jgi:hypothetical protein
MELNDEIDVFGNKQGEDIFGMGGSATISP